MEKTYYCINTETCTKKIDQEKVDDILAIKNTDFYKNQIEKGRDFCFWNEEKITAKTNSFEQNNTSAFTLNTTDVMSSAASRSYILNENMIIYLHSLIVLRDGAIIDKTNDINVKVLDYVNDENNNNFSNQKKVTFLIRDIQLNDIFIIETTSVKTYSKEDLCNKFFRYSYLFPDSYWKYDKFLFELKNETDEIIEGTYNYFRDEKDNILEKENIIIEKGNSFVFEQNKFGVKEVSKDEIAPFINFTTKKNYSEITGIMSTLYEKSYDSEITEFADDLILKLDSLPSIEHKIKFAIDFVQKEIYYLYNGSDMDGYIPQDAKITYESKQGDCKAKSLLLKILLDYLGVKSEMILINYSADIFIPIYNPSPFNFNHQMLKIYWNDEIYFIDATLSMDHGFLENRQKYSFMYYLEIKLGTDLQKQAPFASKIPNVEEIIHCDVKNNVATFTRESIMRGYACNRTRQLLKNFPKNELIDIHNKVTHRNMNLCENYAEKEINDYFTNVTLEIIDDSKEINEIKILYKATISDPYTKEGKKRFLHYWESEFFLNFNAKSHTHKDFPLWVDRNSVKMEIHLIVDSNIDQNDRFTKQECDIKSKYLNHCVKKKIFKNGISCYLNHQTYNNLAISGEELQEYIKIDNQILDNNWGVGIDLIEESIFKKISLLLKKK